MQSKCHTPRTIAKGSRQKAHVGERRLTLTHALTQVSMSPTTTTTGIKFSAYFLSFGFRALYDRVFFHAVSRDAHLNPRQRKREREREGERERESRVAVKKLRTYSKMLPTRELVGRARKKKLNLASRDV